MMLSKFSTAPPPSPKTSKSTDFGPVHLHEQIPKWKKYQSNDNNVPYLYSDLMAFNFKITFC